MNELIKSFGAHESEVDPRTVQHSDVSEASAVPLIEGGIVYGPADIENQHTVGICTAIDRVQLRQKQTGLKYSPDFQYLLQKKFYDFNWTEGSSILNANKVAAKYGFLPINLFTYVTELDRTLPYAQYIAKLQAIPDTEIQRLLSLCVNKIAGYAQVDVSDPQKIAQAILNSPQQAGIQCRFWTDSNWWTGVNGVSSWQPKDIDPIRAPKSFSDGHSIAASKFDFTASHLFTHPNTWGITWDVQGNCHINWDNYKMTEAWVDLETSPAITYPTLRIGMTGTVVRDLQTKLNAKLAHQIVVDGNFGVNTQHDVMAFQILKGLTADGVVGPLTWAQLNS